jgi:glycosyltransferase involved in cell wall biosynthesis
MRILLSLNTARPHIDGVGISLERHAYGLARRGHAVALVAPAPRIASYDESVGGYRAYRIRTVPYDAHHRRFPLFPDGPIERALRDFRPEVVVVSLPFLVSRATWRVARRHGLPVVGITSVMPEWFYYNVPFVQPVARLLEGPIWRYIASYYNNCDHVVGVSETALRLLRDRGLNRPATVISNGVPTSKFLPRPADRGLAAKLSLPMKPTILYAGRLDAEKCVDVLIRAIPRVLAAVDAHFIIGGDGGDRRSLEEMALRLGVAKSISFVGFLPDDVYVRLFSLADAFAIASPAELQSVVTLEAMASGLPIVAAKAGALPDLVVPGLNGFLFPQGDHETLAKALQRVLLDRDTRRRMGEASRQIALDHDLTLTLDRYEETYDAVVARAGDTGRLTTVAGPYLSN